jgi:hypothetical protein
VSDYFTSRISFALSASLTFRPIAFCSKEFVDLGHLIALGGTSIACILK